ncbi:MAG: polysaccharide biosynthesis tyrosine autokinase [Chitinophagaceae bacterium]|nr:polysaccharide biosynthesis tyrosine autokinase [Chitinophagaceae bacterium]
MQPGNQKIKSPKPPEKKILAEIMFKYLPYWPVFVVLMGISLFGAWFYLRMTPKVYEANASIMIKDETKGTQDAQMMEDLDQLSGKKIIENEVEVLKSKSLMRDVVKNLHLYATFFEEGDMMPGQAYTTSPVVIEAANPELLKKADKVGFTFSEKDSSVTIGSTKYPINQTVKSPWGELKFVGNKRFARKAENPLYFTLKNVRGAAGSYSSKLSVMGSKTSTVVSVSQKDEVPERSEDVLNELFVVYDKASMADKSRLASATLDFIQKRLDVVGTELKEIEQKAKTYKSSQGAVDISTQGELYLKSVGETDSKLNEVNIQLSVLDQVEKYINASDNGASVSVSTLGLKDPALTELLNKITEKELAYEKLKKTTGENNPLSLSLKGEINKLKPSVLENIRNQRTSLQASSLNLHSSNNTYSSMLGTIPQKEKDLIEISREQNIKSNIYSFLLQKKEASALSIITNIDDSRVIDRAQSSYVPVAPKSSMIYMVALIFSIALPVGFIAMKGMFNNKISFRHEIESLTSFPIIGEVAYDKSKDAVVIQEGKRTFIAEQFRRIRTSLAYLGISHAGKKRVLVTSSLSGEGKSFIALNLSLSLAMTGKKVILLELDLANPSLSNKLDVEYKQGVSNYLRGECEPEEVIKRTVANNNLFFLPSGPLPDNPSELLMNERLKELLDYLEDIFDYVIIDSAPCTLLSDAYVLSPLCHATLYVVKHKYTPKVYIERLEQENSINQLINVGMIFNGIRSRGFSKNGYGYGYGYGYIHDSTGKKGKKVKKSYKKQENK